MSKPARQIAFEILLKIEKDKAYSNLAIDSAVKAFCPDSTDCAFISRLVYGVTERKITLDYGKTESSMHGRPCETSHLDEATGQCPE